MADKDSDVVVKPAADGKDAKKEKPKEPMASAGEVFSFIWDLGPGAQAMFFLGCLAGVANGIVYPALAYLFSTSFSDVATASSDGLGPVRNLAFSFMVVGVYALAMSFLQSGLLEFVATKASRRFRTEWFSSLLRQDAAFYDVYDVAGMAARVGPDSRKFHKGIGKKLGEGVQFFTTFLGGLAYAFYSSWQVALVILGVLPFVSLAAYGTLQINQQKGSRAAKSYAKAGSVAYSTVSSIKTVLSLNAVTKMVNEYKEATLEAYKIAIKPLIQQGFSFGSMLGTFILLYCVLTLFGTYLMYDELRKNGCDPSSSVADNPACGESGQDVFGAMLGVAFAGQGISQSGNFFEHFSNARVACYRALQAITRKPGSEQKEIYYEDDEQETDKSKSFRGDPTETEGEKRLRAILPKYEIDSSSDVGKKPDAVVGEITFEDVHFKYPTRPNTQILQGLDLTIEAGKTTAIVGPRYVMENKRIVSR